MSAQHTPEPFVREPRYLIFKIKDALSSLSSCELDRLQEIGEKISASRSSEGKPPFNAVVVEQDWPEFDLVWEMIEARMAGKGKDARRIVACVNACAGIPTDELESFVVNGFARAIADRIQLEKQRDDLLAVLETAYKIATESPDDQPFDWATYCEMLYQAIASVKEPS